VLNATLPPPEIPARNCLLLSTSKVTEVKFSAEFNVVSRSPVVESKMVEGRSEVKDAVVNVKVVEAAWDAQ